jgi:hypothetical protein
MMREKRLTAIPGSTANEIDDPNFETIPRSTASMQQEPLKAAPYNVVRTRIRQVLFGKNARAISGQELFDIAYAGFEKPTFNALEKQIGLLRDEMAAEGNPEGPSSTTWFVKIPVADIPRRPRKPPTT